MMFKESRTRMKPIDSDLLFDEVMKKSLTYSQKYNTSQTRKTAELQSLKLSPEKRNNSSAKSEISVSFTYVLSFIDLFCSKIVKL